MRAWQAGFDALGVAEGGRVAVVSHNAARLLELMYAVPSSGRICVPVNFRLRAEEVDYIVGHSGASVLFVDPELDEPLASVQAVKHRFVLGSETDAGLMPEFCAKTFRPSSEAVKVPMTALAPRLRPCW